MGRLHTGTLVAAVLGLLLGCAGAKPKQVGDSQPTDPSMSAPSSDAEPSGPASQSANDSSPSEPTASKHKPKGKANDADDDYEITPADCDALGEHYRELLHKSETGKLEAKKLPDKMLPKAQADVDKIVEQGAERWSKACQGIVNSPQKRSRLTCALEAKEFDRFNDCWSGKVDAEPAEGKP